MRGYYILDGHDVVEVPDVLDWAECITDERLGVEREAVRRYIAIEPVYESDIEAAHCSDCHGYERSRYEGDVRPDGYRLYHSTDYCLWLRALRALARTPHEQDLT